MLCIYGCSSSKPAADAPKAKIPEVAVAADNKPQPSAEAALQLLLTAEQRNDHEASYAVVVHGAGQSFPSAAKWADARRDRPGITGFKVEKPGAGANEVVAVVDHQPMLDPFVGDVPAREREIWKAHPAGNGWLLEQEPELEPQYPDERGAIDAARTWFTTVQRCDQKAAAGLQGVKTLFNSLSSDVRVCGSTGAPTLDPTIAKLPDGPLSADIVAEYDTGALNWARVVNVTAPVKVSIVLAPVGDAWKIIGLGDPISSAT
jgi:hypothetical protein